MSAEIAGTDWARARRKFGTHVFLFSCMAVVVAFFAWSTVGELDVVSAVIGEVVPSSNVKNVQHLEGGIVRRILVREGDKVNPHFPSIVDIQCGEKAILL